MKLRQYQVDAFANHVFEGNPAAVCPLEYWLDDPWLQAIASENNLSETAFFLPDQDGFALRWFTPTKEIDLCGHATLATAHVLFEHLGYAQRKIRFSTRSGDLWVERREQRLAMDFPAQHTETVDPPDALIAGLGVHAIEVLAGVDYLVVLDSEADVSALDPDMGQLKQLDRRGVIVTAPGEHKDFVSRFFAPRFGIPEDPVTGSAHCQLARYWAERLGKKVLSARQISSRGGDVDCELNGTRVTLLGNAVTFMQGEIEIPA